MLTRDSPRNTAIHIAANSPDVVMAHIDEILRLRAEVVRLEREADWLAAAVLSWGGCPSAMERPACTGHCPNCWRETARKIVEEMDS